MHLGVGLEDAQRARKHVGTLGFQAVAKTSGETATSEQTEEQTESPLIVCPACTLENPMSNATCRICGNILPSGRRASDILFESPMAPKPAPIASTVLDPKTIADIIDVVVKAVAAAMPTVPAAVARQVRVEAERAVQDISVASSTARRKIQSAVQGEFDSIKEKW